MKAQQFENSLYFFLIFFFFQMYESFPQVLKLSKWRVKFCYFSFFRFCVLLYFLFNSCNHKEQCVSFMLLYPVSEKNEVEYFYPHCVGRLRDKILEQNLNGAKPFYHPLPRRNPFFFAFRRFLNYFPLLAILEESSFGPGPSSLFSSSVNAPSHPRVRKIVLPAPASAYQPFLCPRLDDFGPQFP